MHEGSRRAILAALLANAGIACAKFAAFAVTGSSAMLAEGIHSVADTSNQGVLLYGGRAARRGADDEHPFGRGRERYFWAFIVALILFSVGGLFAIYEGWHKVRDPHELTSPEWAIGVLAVAIVLESFSLRTAVRESNAVRGDASWVAFVRRSRSPELPVVLLEDLGALVGLVFALAGVGLSVITGDPVFDAAATLAIGVLLVTIAIVLAVEMKSLLIGEPATADDEAAIAGAITARPEVSRLIHMRTQHLGPDELLVGAKVEFRRGLDLAGLAAAVDAVERAVRAAVPAARFVYLEPDLYRADP